MKNLVAKKNYDAYIFDLDGTITDSLVVWLGIFRDCLQQFGITPPSDKVISQHTHDWKQMLLLGLPEKDLPDFIAFAHTLATKRLPEAPLHEGAYTMLETLKKQGKKIAIFSTMDRPIFEPMLKFHNLHLLVTVAIAGTDVPHRKPHPEGLIKALEDLTVPTTEYKKVVYIGDKDTDIQTAHNAGVDAMLYYPKTHQALYSLQELKRHNPEFIINNWQELIV